MGRQDEQAGADGAEVIGLRRHTVQLVEHRREWADLFAEEASELRQAVGDLFEDIQHVGSTAVEGLPAKPILDIAAALRSAGDVSAVIERLRGLAYIYRGDSGSDGGHLFAKESEADVRTIHLHAVAHNDPQWRDYLAFRDILRRDVEARARYAKLKRHLAEEFSSDRRSYTAGKNAFIQQLLKEEAQPQ